MEASPGVTGRAAIQHLGRGCPEHPEGALRLHPVTEKRAWTEPGGMVRLKWPWRRGT